MSSSRLVALGAVVLQLDSGALQTKLVGWLTDCRRLVIAGVGNSLRSDDGLGVALVGRLGKLPRNVMAIDCGAVPETYVGPIRRFLPSHILIVDAADIGLSSGSVRLVSPEEIVGMALSTHTLPLRVFTDYLVGQTHAKVALLAVQPKNTDFGEGLSPEIEETLRLIVDVVEGLLIK